MGTRDISRMLKTIVRWASPSVTACEGSSYALFLLHLCSIFETDGHYVMDIYCVLSNIASVSYCYYICELNILGTRIEASVPLSRPGYDTS
jgi:hypothetical protein